MILAFAGSSCLIAYHVNTGFAGVTVQTGYIGDTAVSMFALLGAEASIIGDHMCESYQYQRNGCVFTDGGSI